MSQELLIAALGEHLGMHVKGLHPLGGGDMADAFRVELVGGGHVFAKTHPNPPPQFFDTEAAGLRWLTRARAVPVPDVLAVHDANPAFLVLSWIEPGQPNADTEAVFGRQLATLHASGAQSFGRVDRRTTGSLALPNEPCDSWSVFFASQRLLPLAQRARDRGSLHEHTVQGLERVANRLEFLDVPIEPPARLHGDLWAGNRVVGKGGVSWLLDPAAHGGHREFDLAMMQLFGGFGSDAFEAYEDAHQLAEGWRDRIPIHQLAPLVVHAIKFGGSYIAATERIVEALR